ncbi:hypothetical protein C0J52_21583 [Blattella germanica]|nr:hypothetical protein C0J52_21583 [Blattella germanica]
MVVGNPCGKRGGDKWQQLPGLIVPISLLLSSVLSICLLVVLRMNIRSKKKFSCAVNLCPNNVTKSRRIGEVIYHRFPKNRILKLKWLSRCNQHTNPYNSTVCSAHFRPEDYEEEYVEDSLSELLLVPRRNILRPNAIPSLLIYDQEQEENEEKKEVEEIDVDDDDELFQEFRPIICFAKIRHVTNNFLEY